jgi:hypothetical protein
VDAEKDRSDAITRQQQQNSQVRKSCAHEVYRILITSDSGKHWTSKCFVGSGIKRCQREPTSFDPCSIPSQGNDTIDVLEVRSVEGHLYRAIVTDVIASEQSNNPRLVFTRSDSRVFLSEVWERGRQAGCRLQTHNEHTETAESENDKVILTASVDWP